MDFLTWFIALGDQLLYRQITTWGMTKESERTEIENYMHVLFFFFCDQDYIYIHIRKQKRLEQTTRLASSSHGILRCLCFQSRAASFTVDGRRPSQRTAVEH